MKLNRLLYLAVAAAAVWFVWRQFGDRIWAVAANGQAAQKRDIGPGSHFTLPWESATSSQDDFVTKIAKAIGSTQLQVNGIK